MLGTRNLVAGLRALPEAERPKVLVSQSGVGFYGPRGDEPVDEDAAGGRRLPRARGAWTGRRRRTRRRSSACAWCITRTGVVLSPSAARSARCCRFFKLGVGGPVAGGRQYMPWIHLDDVVGADLFALDTPR